MVREDALSGRPPAAAATLRGILLKELVRSAAVRGRLSNPRQDRPYDVGRPDPPSYAGDAQT